MSEVIGSLKKFWWAILLGLLFFFGGAYMVIGIGGGASGVDGTQR